jgi:hypothetical protein
MVTIAQYAYQSRGLLEYFGNNRGLITAACGTDSRPLETLLNLLGSQVCTVASSVTNILDFLTCQNFNSVYATVAYQGLCYNAMSGFAWISSTVFFIVLFSFIMLTLRVAFYEIEDEDSYSRRGCFASCCCCCRCRRRGKVDEMMESEHDLAMKEAFRDEVEAPSGKITASSMPSTPDDDAAGQPHLERVVII